MKNQRIVRGLLILASVALIASCGMLEKTTSGILSKTNEWLEKAKSLYSRDWERTVNTDSDFEFNFDQNTLIAYQNLGPKTDEPKRVRLDWQMPESVRKVLWVKQTHNEFERRLLPGDVAYGVVGDYFNRDNKLDPETWTVFVDLDPTKKKNRLLWKIHFLDSSNRIRQTERALIFDTNRS